MKVPLLLLTGPVGVGKTTVALEASELLRADHVPHAVVDLDALTWCYPPPAGDRFNTRLAFRNLAAIWSAYAEAGAQRLIVARVIEDRSELLAYRDAVPGAEITVVRLRASWATLQERIAHREVGVGRAWSEARSAELALRMDRQTVEDSLVETDDRSITQVAREVLLRASGFGSEGL